MECVVDVQGCDSRSVKLAFQRDLLALELLVEADNLDGQPTRLQFVQSTTHVRILGTQQFILFSYPPGTLYRHSVGSLVLMVAPVTCNRQTSAHSLCPHVLDITASGFGLYF